MKLPIFLILFAISGMLATEFYLKPALQPVYDNELITTPEDTVTTDVHISKSAVRTLKYEKRAVKTNEIPSETLSKPILVIRDIEEQPEIKENNEKIIMVTAHTSLNELCRIYPGWDRCEELKN